MTTAEPDPTVTTSNGASTPSTSTVDAARRTRDSWPFLLLALASIVAGGLVAAVVAHAPTEHPVWASAYLVLVTGVAQVGLVLGRALLSSPAPRPAALNRDLGLWTLGNIGVLVGTLVDRTWVVDAGGVLLVLALALCIWAVRGHAPVTTQQRWALWLLWSYRLIVVILLVSIPVGLVLARR